MRQEWSVTRVAEHEWPLVARMMPGHESGGQEEGKGCQGMSGQGGRMPSTAATLCVSDRDPRWNLDPATSEKSFACNLSSSQLITLRMLPLF